MTRDETKMIVTIIATTFPNFPKMEQQELSMLIDSWAVFLREYEYKDISMALNMFVQTSGSVTYPKITQLIDMVHKPSEMAELNENEAWALVDKAISRSSYYAEEEFQKLGEISPLIQKAVGSPANLREWARTDYKAIESVIASNFRTTYMRVIQRDREMRRMPAEARHRLQELQHLALEGET